VHIQNDRQKTGPGAGLLAVFAGVTSLLALVQLFTVTLGAARVPFGREAALAVLAVATVLSILFATRFLPERHHPAQSPPAPPRALSDRLLGFLAGLVAFAAVVWAAWVWTELWILASLRPPYDWDGLYYHLPAIHDWAAAGRVMFIDYTPDVPFVNFPMGVELTTFFTYFLLGTSRLVNACNLWYWPMAFLAIAVIARRLGARGPWPLVAGALIVGAPVFVCQSVSCYIDPGFAAAVMAAIAAACVFVFETGRPGRWSPVLLGMAAGLALGSKGTGLPFAVVVVVVAVAGSVWARGGLGRWRAWLPRAGVVVLFVFLVGGYWYARNGLNTGNPVYPIQVKFGEKVLADGWDHNIFNEANLPPWLERYPRPLRMFVSWTQPDAPVSGYAPVGGMGYIWLFGAVPALLYLWLLAARRRYPGPAREFVFVTVLALCLFAVQPASWWSRFTVWMHALGLPCIAVAAHHAASSWRRSWWHALILAVALAMVGTAVWESGRTLDVEWEDGRTSSAPGVRAEFQSSLDYMFPGMSEALGFQEFFDAARIARSPWEQFGTLLGGILAMPLEARSITVMPMYPEESDVASLRESGVEWIIWDVVGAGEAPEAVTQAASKHHAFNPAPDVNFHIYRLRN
jgi:hypothetical protein